MKRYMQVALMISGLLVVACGQPADSGPKEIPQIDAAADDDAYEMGVYAEARSKWEPLAEQGDAVAQRSLGMMFYLGQGLDPDYDEAFKLFTQAAEQGEDVAQLSLGAMYAEGQGVPQDSVRSLMWLTLSSEQGNGSAQHRMRELIGKMSREEIAEGKELAKAWTPSQ